MGIRDEPNSLDYRRDFLAAINRFALVEVPIGANRTPITDSLSLIAFKTVSLIFT